MNYDIITQISDSGETVYTYKDSIKKVPLNSMYSPTKEAHRFIKKINQKTKKVYILLGIGNGEIVKQLIMNTQCYIHFYIIEPFKNVPADVEFHDIVHQRKNVSFAYYEDFLMVEFMSLLEKFNSVETEILMHPHYEKTAPDYLKEIFNKLNQTITLAQINRNTEQRFRKDWILEPLLSLPYWIDAHSIEELKDKYKGKTAILAASGPSLKQNVDFLKKARNSTYIFAAGSAVNGLMNNGIIPDFVTSFDSGDVNYEAHFKNTLYEGPLIAGSLLNSKIMKHHNGPIIHAQLTLDDVSRRVKKTTHMFPPVPSVAVFTLQIMYFLGFSKIYLVGQDLAYVNGKYYADGVSETSASKKVNADIIVKSNSGLMVDTSHSLYSFLESFVYLIQQIDSEKMEIYNLSKDGAYIKGTTYIDPCEIDIVKELGPKDITDSFCTTSPSEQGFIEGLKIIKEFEDFILVLQDAHKGLTRLNPRAVTINDIKKVLKIFSTIRSYSIFEDIITQRMTSLVQRINNLFVYKLDKEQTTNEDRILMVEEIKKLVMATEKFVDSLLKDERIKQFKGQYSKYSKKSNPV